MLNSFCSFKLNRTRAFSDLTSFSSNEEQENLLDILLNSTKKLFFQRCEGVILLKKRKIIGKYSKSKIEIRWWYDSVLAFPVKSEFLIMINIR